MIIEKLKKKQKELYSEREVCFRKESELTKRMNNISRLIAEYYKKLYEDTCNTCNFWEDGDCILKEIFTETEGKHHCDETLNGIEAYIRRCE